MKINTMLVFNDFFFYLKKKENSTNIQSHEYQGKKINFVNNYNLIVFFFFAL